MKVEVEEEKVEEEGMQGRWRGREHKVLLEEGGEELQMV